MKTGTYQAHINFGALEEEPSLSQRYFSCFTPESARINIRRWVFRLKVHLVCLGGGGSNSTLAHFPNLS